MEISLNAATVMNQDGETVDYRQSGNLNDPTVFQFSDIIDVWGVAPSDKRECCIIICLFSTTKKSLHESFTYVVLYCLPFPPSG